MSCTFFRLVDSSADDLRSARASSFVLAGMNPASRKSGDAALRSPEHGPRRLMRVDHARSWRLVGEYPTLNPGPPYADFITRWRGSDEGAELSLTEVITREVITKESAYETLSGSSTVGDFLLGLD